MSYKPRYDKSDWIAICDSCGKKFKASALRKRWDGFMVCKEDWEPRHPQDFVRAISDVQAAPWTSNEPTDTFIAVSNPTAIAGTAVAGYAVPGTIGAPDPVLVGTFTL